MTSYSASRLAVLPEYQRALRAMNDLAQAASWLAEGDEHADVLEEFDAVVANMNQILGHASYHQQCREGFNLTFPFATYAGRIAYICTDCGRYSTWTRKDNAV